MDCRHYDAGRCRSCDLLEVAYPDQVARKAARLRAVLPTVPDDAWLPPVTSAESGFRNKAKMVVAGPLEAPTLGILDPRGGGVDLRDCGLHTPGIRTALPELAAFVTRAELAPYDVPRRRGELKHVLVTEAPGGALMVRLVLRSTEALARIRKHLPSLLSALPSLSVLSVNVQPEHKAVLEGEREIVLHGDTLRMSVDGVDLHLRPQSFFQTNTEVAASLYRQAREWADRIRPARVLDLYCGVGGFALHLAGPGRQVTGIEVSAEAVESARRSAADLRVDARFDVGDATAYDLVGHGAPDLVVVNPPRRGLGADLARRFEGSGVGDVVYSSCNPESLARDLAAMPSLRPVQARLFDMFPQTGHLEVMVLMSRH
jgi:23S rRNA (uracil747-C5)-methyltransferase